MYHVHVGAAILNQTPMDWAANRGHIISAIEEAREQGVEILCLPELAITAYGCEDAFLGLDVAERALEELAAISAHCHDIVVCVGLPLRWRGALYNVVALIVNTTVKGFYAKQFLAGDGLHYEPRWFQAWPSEKRVLYTWGEQEIPLGDIYMDIGGLRLGFEICEDAWVPQRPAVQKAQRSLDIVLNPSASHFAFGKFKTRRDIVREGSRALQATYIYTNLLGNESGRIIFDGGAIIASAGTLVALGERFVLDDYQVTHCTVDVTQTRRAQAKMTSFETQVDDDDLCVTVDWTIDGVAQAVPAVARKRWGETNLKAEVFSRAVALGLIDYVRKSHSNGFVISLSGGADSAAVLTLVRIAWNWGIEHFGREQWLQRVGLNKDAQFSDWCHCVYQATNNSGDVTEEAASELANALEANFHSINVNDIVESYQAHVENILGRGLNWQDDDIALQNIQARSRAPSVWMLANCLNALLLATSNRSEAAVGYATMDGDTCGGLSPISGIDKAFLLEWLQWMESTGNNFLPAVSALRFINQQIPTAELRPQDAAQSDEDDLMPYTVLDAIERLAIRDKHAPQDCLTLLRQQFPDYAVTDLLQWVKRFFQLWSRNQWKRERYAPGFHLDDENLDPKTWCRFPILSGGFAAELEALRVEG